jgi:tetratricopeptide (TPR) repeat protein
LGFANLTEILEIKPLMGETVPSRLPVFVCYAHENNDPKDPLSKRWLYRLLQQLSPLAIQDEVCAWSDKDIETGQDWHDRIQQTLENTKAAVLLVSPAFLASKYIRNSELPVLLKNAKDRGVIILPVIVRHCLFKETKFKFPDPVNGPEELSLATLQSANSPTTPLNSLSEHEQDKVLLEVAQSLLKILQKPSSPETSIGNGSKPVWNVPFERNPFFTGREDILVEIRAALLSSGRAAFSGLGGIGKTQTAVEYAYRHKDDYSHILWVKADSKESLTLDFAQLDNLADLYREQRKYAQAEGLYKRACTIWELALGPTHPDVATSLNNLASLYHQKGKFAKAEPLYQRSLGILEKALGSEHPNTQKVKANYEICLKRWRG